MTDLSTVVTWVDARERLPHSGAPVAAAVTGRYPAEPGSASGDEFWLVLPMYFTALHWGKDGTEHHDCFVDSDGIVRLPYGPAGDESVTHWAELPTLPGAATRIVLGEGVPAALRNAYPAA